MEDLGPRNAQDSGEDYKELLEQFNQPGSLQGLQDNIKALQLAIHSLEAYNKSLEIAQNACEKEAIDLEKKVQYLQSRLETLHRSTMPRACKLEQSVSSLKRGRSQPSADVVQKHQQLWGLMWQAPNIYTPKVLRHLLEKELKQFTSLSDRLVFLAKKHHRIHEIKKLYMPDSHIWVDLKPMDPRLEVELRSLPPKEQEERMNWYWTEIVRYFKEDTCGIITLFEMEDQTLQMESHEERYQFLQEYIKSGREAARDLTKKKNLALIKKLMGLGKP